MKHALVHNYISSLNKIAKYEEGLIIILNTRSTEPY